MQPHTLKSIASAAEVFSVARRQLQVAVDAANHLGLVVPDSFPDAIDYLQDWAASVEAEARGLLQLTDPANAHQPADGQRLASVATGNVCPVPARAVYEGPDSGCRQ